MNMIFSLLLGFRWYKGAGHCKKLTTPQSHNFSVTITKLLTIILVFFLDRIVLQERDYKQNETVKVAPVWCDGFKCPRQPL